MNMSRLRDLRSPLRYGSPMPDFAQPPAMSALGECFTCLTSDSEHVTAVTQMGGTSLCAKHAREAADKAKAAAQQLHR